MQSNIIYKYVQKYYVYELVSYLVPWPRFVAHPPHQSAANPPATLQVLALRTLALSAVLTLLWSALPQGRLRRLTWLWWRQWSNAWTWQPLGQVPAEWHIAHGIADEEWEQVPLFHAGWLNSVVSVKGREDQKIKNIKKRIKYTNVYIYTYTYRNGEGRRGGERWSGNKIKYYKSTAMSIKANKCCNKRKLSSTNAIKWVNIFI